ncbi:MAG: EF-hand domain-containing protein [Sphingomicrobium sp.]
MPRSLTFLFAAPALALASAAAGQSAPKPVTRAAVSSQLDSAFAAADTNHDGALGTAEFQTLETKQLERVQATLRARMQAQFKALDTNKDGQLSLQEFSAATPGVRANETPAQLLQQLDSNRDGKVSAAEFKASRLAAFDRADTNHDGTLTSAEAQAAAKKK